MLVMSGNHVTSSDFMLVMSGNHGCSTEWNITRVLCFREYSSFILTKLLVSNMNSTFRILLHFIISRKLSINLKHLHSHHKLIILYFPSIVIPPQFHTQHLNTQDGTSERHKGEQLRMTIFFYGKWCTMYNNNWTTWCRWWIQPYSFLGQTNLYSIISCNIQGLNTKKQKYKVQLISELANNENILIITLTCRNAFKWKNTSLRDTNEELHWISCRSNLR